jgi:hypothetical protein
MTALIRAYSHDPPNPRSIPFLDKAARKRLSKAICFIVVTAIVTIPIVVTEALPMMSFTVTSTADGGPGSLRQAILDANANPGLDSIDFNIPAPGVQTIAPLSPLPVVTDSVIIDGYTQPGSSPNTLPSGDDAVLLIEIDGSSAGVRTDGLYITGGKSIVRGLVINRFDGNGIVLDENGANWVEGNFIGTDPRGAISLENGDCGVIVYSSSNNRIGGATPSARNLLSGNGLSGVFLTGGTQGNQVQGNFIGTDSAGTNYLSNFFNGITLVDASNNTIGGTKASMRNVISANCGNGVEILRATSTGNRIQGNFIGTKADGLGPLGNTTEGVSIYHLAANNQIGGTSAAAGNRIAYNGRQGVCIFSGTGNSILSNSIHSNGRIGIDLISGGVTTNDPCDTDTGANNLQNAPELGLLSASGGACTIEVKIDSAPGTAYRIEFFSSAACDPTGSGEGQTLIASTSVSTGGSCLVTFNAIFGPGVVPPGHFVTATMTDPAGNTSEFSNCVMMP